MVRTGLQTNAEKAKYAYVDKEIKSISVHTQLQVSTYLRPQPGSQLVFKT